MKKENIITANTKNPLQIITCSLCLISAEFFYFHFVGAIERTKSNETILHIQNNAKSKCTNILCRTIKTTSNKMKRIQKKPRTTFSLRQACREHLSSVRDHECDILTVQKVHTT